MKQLLKFRGERSIAAVICSSTFLLCSSAWAQPGPAGSGGGQGQEQPAEAQPAAGEDDTGGEEDTAAAGGPEASIPAGEGSDAAAPAPMREDARSGGSLTAASVADAPMPRDASGVLIPESRRRYLWLWGPRALLFVPRWVLEGVFLAPRGALYVYDRYQVSERVKGIFFNDTETLGLYPVAFFETGFGLNIGARFIYRDLFATGSRVRVRASYGGQFRQVYSLSMESGELFGKRVSAELDAGLQIFPKSLFFGIGNGDLIDEPPMGLINPINDDTAVSTRFRHNDILLRLSIAAKLVEHVSVRVSTAFKTQDFDDNDPDETLIEGEPSLVTVYDPMGLVGFGQGLSTLYGELELSYDTRRVSKFFLSAATPSTGWHLTAFAGYAKGLVDEDPSKYVRYGADLQRFIDLYHGDRVLALRLYHEAVSDDVDEVPFTALPRLGGPIILRGYDRDRFRDRMASLASIEYLYPIADFMSGYLFTDAGLVHRSMDDISLDNARIGYGGGFQFQSKTSFRARLALSSSIDSDLFIYLSFDPVFDFRSREGQDQ